GTDLTAGTTPRSAGVAPRPADIAPRSSGTTPRSAGVAPRPACTNFATPATLVTKSQPLCMPWKLIHAGYRAGSERGQRLPLRVTVGPVPDVVPLGHRHAGVLHLDRHAVVHHVVELLAVLHAHVDAPVRDVLLAEVAG